MAVVLALWAATFASPAQQPISSDNCMMCHEDKYLTRADDHGRSVSLYVDLAILAASSHRTIACTSCHRDVAPEHPDNEIALRPVDCAVCHEGQSDSFQASVHGLALQAGQPSATCADCHGTHNVLSPTAPESPLHFSRLATTCGACHPNAAEEVNASVHGRAAAGGVREAATCTDCHSEHRIEGLAGASVNKVAGEICSKCHASERINTKFRLPGYEVKSYFESYHGLASQAGLTRAANCASCHGYHRILPSSDPESSIHQGRLVQTCGQCHPGATGNFALPKIHANGTSDAEIGAVINRWVRRLYIGLIIGVVGLLGLHNLLAWLRKALMSYRSPDRTVVRMDRSQRVQHMVLLTSFIVLALSGFALRFPESWLAWVMGSEEIRRWIHRGAGLVLLAAGVYHIVYLAATLEGRRLARDFWPRKQDAKDISANVKYLAGRSPRKARVGRFGYTEKFEYWAVVWGTIIMGVTGLMIWFKIGVTQFLPRWVIDVAATVHYYEAILACLAIVVWHFYHVIFDPGVYPMNWAWWDGRVTRDWQKEEHALELPTSGNGPANPPGTEVPVDSANRKLADTGSRRPIFP